MKTCSGITHTATHVLCCSITYQAHTNTCTASSHTWITCKVASHTRQTPGTHDHISRSIIPDTPVERQNTPGTHVYMRSSITYKAHMFICTVTSQIRHTYAVAAHTWHTCTHVQQNNTRGKHVQWPHTPTTQVKWQHTPGINVQSHNTPGIHVNMCSSITHQAHMYTSVTV